MESEEGGGETWICEERGDFFSRMSMRVEERVTHHAAYPAHLRNDHDDPVRKKLHKHVCLLPID